MTNNTILVVVDDDAEEMSSQARAVQMAHAFGAKIELFSAVFDVYIAGERLFDSEDLVEAKTRKLQEHHEKLELLAAPLRAEGLEVLVDVVWDEPVYEGIVRKVLRSDPRMVIRNSHYHHPLSRTLFSNDDWNLIRTCPAPLLISRSHRYQHKALKICAAIDPMHNNDKPAELDLEILRHASALAEHVGGKLSVVHAYDAAPVIGGISAGTMLPIIPDVEEIKTSVRDEHLSAVTKLIEESGVEVSEFHHLPGDPRKVLLGFAVEHEIDLMVMGVVSRGFIERHLVGNTAEKIVDRLPCDLLIVKSKDFETPVHFKSKHRFKMAS